MESTYYSKYNPFFRRNLFNSLVGKKLLDISFLFKNHFAEEGQIDISQSNLCQLIFEDITVEVAYGSLCHIEFRELRKEQKTKEILTPLLLPDKSGIGRGAIGEIFSNKNSFKKSIQNIEIDYGLSALIGEKVQSFFLITEGKGFKNKYRSKYWNEFGVHGIGINFLSNELLIYYYPYERGLFFDVNGEFRSGFLLTKTEELFELGKKYENKEFKNFQLLKPSILLNDMSIYRKEAIKEEVMDRAFFGDQKMILEESYNQLLNLIKYTDGSITINEQIHFLEFLKKDMMKNGYTLIDLKFGFDENYKLKLVYPLDIVPLINENIVFIDRMLSVFRKCLLAPRWCPR